MRYFLILLVLIAAVIAALFFVPLENGKPLLNWQQVEDNWQDPGQLLDGGVESLVNKSEQTTLFRWRDPQGNWQYGQIPPPGVDAEEMTIQAR